MPNSTDTLEKNAAGHRAKLGDTLSALSQAINPDRISSEVRASTGDLSQTLVSTAMNAARRSPAGLALVALGAAVMTLNPPRKTESTLADPTGFEGQDARIAAADARMAEKSRIAHRDDTRPSSHALKKWLDAGLDKLPPEARDRVITARLKAIDAQEALERQTVKAARAARDAHNAQPLVTSLAVAGVGALIGALLPSTKTESDLMGAKRDQMLRHAEAVLRSEMDGLQERGESALRSGLSAAKEDLHAAQQD